MQKTPLLFLMIFLISIIPSLAQLQINEIMYDPGQCPDSHCEWIELFNTANHSINLSSCSFNEKKLSGMLPAEEYLLIVRNKNNFTSYFGETENIIELSLNLKNSGAVVELTGNENCSVQIDYTSLIDLADGNNKTLERRADNSWGESIVEGGTPGEQNSIWKLSTEYAALEITEIMPNPFDEDDGSKPHGEWIELYNSGKEEIDLEGLLLQDEQGKLPIASNKVLVEQDGKSNVKSTVKSTVICGGCYKVIYRDGDSDFALNQDYDNIRLSVDNTVNTADTPLTSTELSESSLIDSASYAGSTEGMSWSKLNNKWFQTLPTPGAENAYKEGCDWQLKLILNNAIFTESEPDDLEFDVVVERIYGFEQQITARGVIEDIFGEEVKKYSPWTDKQVTTKVSKSYSPNLAEGVYQLSFWLKDLSCDEQNPLNNKITRLIAINPQYKQKNSSLEIERLYLGNDEKAEWGDQFTVKVNLYKGEETKYSIGLWAEKNGEKVSKTTKVSLFDSYKHYPLTLPVQLEPNCNGKIKDGKAQLVVEGLGLRKEKEFKVEGVDNEVCRDYLDYLKEQGNQQGGEGTKQAGRFEIIALPPSAAPDDVLLVKIQLLNDQEEHEYNVWSYLYRGKRCYSCNEGTEERDANMQTAALQENEAKVLEFLLKIDGALKEGEYKVKVKARKDQQKTVKELTKAIFIQQGEEKESNSSLPTLAGGGEEPVSSGYSISPSKARTAAQEQGIVIYESSSQKAKNSIPFFLAVTFALLCIVLLWKK